MGALPIWLTEIVATFTSWLDSVLGIERVIGVLMFVAVFAVGVLFARIVTHFTTRGLFKHLKASRAELLKRLLFYALVFLALAISLKGAGFDVSALWGAAGILTVAIGFASQTSASNIISGLFLVAEHPFEEGDEIQINQFNGEVISVDLLSVKIRTFDNLFVRIPNEMMVKSEMINYTKFPIRRFDISLVVPVDTDLARLEKILTGLAHQHPHGLEEPRPLFRLRGFLDGGLETKFFIWARREVYYGFRTEFLALVNKTLVAEGIRPFIPHRNVLLTSDLTEKVPDRADSTRTLVETPTESKLKD